MPSAGTLVRILFCLVLVHAATAWSQQPPGPDVSARELLEAEQAADQALQEKVQTGQKGIVLESTPLNTMLGLRKAVDEKDWEAAERYVDRRFLPDEMQAFTVEQLLQALSYVFGRQNILDLGAISDAPGGNPNDGLPPYRDQVGTVTLSTGDVPIYLQRVPDGDGGRIWKLSNATVARIPEMWAELGYGPVVWFLRQHLPEVRFMGLDNWQLVATGIAMLLAWPLAAAASYLLMRVALLIPNRFPKGIRRFFRRSVRFFLFVQISGFLIGYLGLSLTARILLESSGAEFIAWTVLLLGVVSLLRDYHIRKMQDAGNAQYVALLRPFTTFIKVILVIVSGLIWAHHAGYNMTTLLAGLGVGSVAVALAAQKTLENLIGTVMLYAARPVRVGDFCRFGSVLGTVEEIGLRSTLIRTLEDTVVFIPNGVFSSDEIENFSQRRSIRYFRRLGLQLGDAQQLRSVLAKVSELLLVHPRVLHDSVSVRFETIEGSNAMLRINGAVDTRDFSDYLAVAEELNLSIVDIVEAAGGLFSGPGQLLQLREPRTREATCSSS